MFGNIFGNVKSRDSWLEKRSRQKHRFGTTTLHIMNGEELDPLDQMYFQEAEELRRITGREIVETRGLFSLNITPRPTRA